MKDGMIGFRRAPVLLIGSYSTDTKRCTMETPSKGFFLYSKGFFLYSFYWLRGD